MTTRIKLRRDTAANWLEYNPILAAGEPGLETDTGKIKYGDGETAWAALPHAGGDTLTDEGGVVVTAGSTEYWVANQRRDDQDTYGRGVRHDSQGNVYALTQTFRDPGNYSVAVITKYSPVGAVIWQYTIDDFRPYSLAVDSSDCAYIAGENSDDSVELWKFSTDGNVLWKKAYDAGNWTGECFIEERTGTRLVMVANRDDGDYGVLVLDINTSTGAVTNKKIIDLDDPIDVFCSGIDTDSDGNVFVTGRYYNQGQGKYMMFIEKLDTDLNRVWSKSVATDTNYDMNAGDCASDSQGNVYAVAYYFLDVNNAADDNTTGTMGLLMKLNSSGAVQWTRRLGPGPCGTGVVGLTATDVGDVYLSTITITPSKNPLLNDENKYAEGDIRMMVARYNTAGAVIWQRYIDDSHTWEVADNFRGQTISVYDDKFVTDYYGNQTNDRQFLYSGSDDFENDCFIVQLPADGTELEIGSLAFKASRIPGRFVEQAVTSSPLRNVVFESSVDVTTSTRAIDSTVRIANNLVKSETYDYVFGADGTLTIPNDGDVRLTQRQIGWLGAFGGAVNYNNYDVTGRAVIADAEGNMYVVGEQQSDYQPFVSKIDPEGQRLWSVGIWDNNNDSDGRANGIALHPVTGDVVVVCEFYDSYTYAAIITIGADTGRIISNIEYRDNNADVYLNELAFLSTGAWVAGGSKYGEFSPDQTVTPLGASTTQKLVIARSEIEGTVTTNWQIGGTGISPFENISSVEQYSNLTGTTTPAVGGVGAQLRIENNGNGTYSLGTPFASGGTGYAVDEFIKVLGTDLGGASPANDLILKITEINEVGAIVNYTQISGTATGSAATYDPVAPVNLTGSGFTFSYFNGPLFSSNYTDNDGYGTSSYGNYYTVGDVVTIPGTSLGGATPANDMTITVISVGYNGELYNWTWGGTAQTTNWTITTYTNVDFSQEGAWTLTYPLSRENLLVHPDWQRTYGTNTGDETDRTYSIAVDSSDNIIAVGQGYGITTGQDSYDLATVYKFSPLGSLQWSKKLNERNYDCYAMSVATVGTDIYVTHDSNDNGETVITKLTATGTVAWQRITDSSDDSVVANSGDGNILVAIEAYNEDIGDNAFKVIKMTPSGEIVYKRWLYANTDNDTNFKNGRSMVVKNGDFYITGYYYANDYNSAFVGKLPADGTGTGDYGQFRYTDVNADTGNYGYNGIYGVNYNVNEVDPGDSYAGALTVTPYVNTATTAEETEGDYYVNSFYVDFDIEEVRDQDGGRIVFADGSVQETSATDIPQRIFRGQKYTLSLKDRGHHILCVESDDSILIPYGARVPFPVGSKIMIINTSGNNVWVYTEGGSIPLYIAGSNSWYNYFYIENAGIVTLINLGRDRWSVSGQGFGYY